MNPRRLIVNGDDFGMSEEVNEAVVFAFRRGILTSTSLMASGAAFDHAVSLAKQNPGLAVGLHLTCANGRPVLPPGRLPHLAGKTGEFLADPGLAGLLYFFCPAARRELLDEIEAQFEKFFRSGLPFSHVDSHCHMHVHPVVLDAIIECAKRYGVKSIRVPADSFFTALPFLDSPVKAACYAIVFKLLTRRMKKILGNRGFIFPRTVYGNMLSGKMSAEYVLRVAELAGEGTSELYLHPALPCGPPGEADAAQLQRFREFLILVRPEVGAELARLGVSLSTYSDMEKEL